MEVSISQSSLAAGVSLAVRLVNHRSALPVLTSVLLAANEACLRLAVIGQEASLVLELDAQVHAPGSVCVPARTFAELLGTLPHEQVALSFQQGKLEVACGQSKGALNCLLADEFPPLPEPQIDEGFTLPARLLKSILQQVIFSAASDASRPVLNGVLLAGNDQNLTLSAADGFRLSVTRLALGTPIDKPMHYLVPARSFSELLRPLGSAEQVTLAPTQHRGQLAFVLPGCTLVTQLIDGTFPDYEQIIPRDYKMRVTLPTAALLTACKQAEIFAKEGSHTVRLSISPGLLTVSGQSEERGWIGSALESEIVGADGSPISEQELAIGFNGIYLREMLQALSTPLVSMDVTNGARGALFRPVGEDGVFYVLMPMHLDR